VSDDLSNAGVIIAVITIVFVGLGSVFIGWPSKSERRTEPSFDTLPQKANPPPSTPTHSLAYSPVAATAPSDPGAVVGTIIIIAGLFIAAGGILSWLFADPTNSAVRQIVAALWLLCGLVGLIITAIGIATIVIERAVLFRGKPPR
jgi:hypothetical protein